MIKKRCRHCRTVGAVPRLFRAEPDEDAIKRMPMGMTGRLVSFACPSCNKVELMDWEVGPRKGGVYASALVGPRAPSKLFRHGMLGTVLVASDVEATSIFRRNLTALVAAPSCFFLFLGPFDRLDPFNDESMRDVVPPPDGVELDGKVPLPMVMHLHNRRHSDKPMECFCCKKLSECCELNWEERVAQLMADEDKPWLSAGDRKTEGVGGKGCPELLSFFDFDEEDDDG